MNVKVSIAVETGGYTGQRDAWESSTHDFELSFEDDGRVKLHNPRSGYGRDTIWFDLDDLAQAVEFVKQQEGA